MELREIFKKFNEAYNTVTGRHLIIQNLIKTAMAESGQSNLDQVYKAIESDIKGKVAQLGQVSAKDRV